jgi:hypothetical protein
VPERTNVNTPEELARRDRLTRRWVEAFERDGLHIMAGFVEDGCEMVRDIVVRPRGPAAGDPSTGSD